MSTIRTLLLVTLPIATLAMATTSVRQQGTGPNKLTGPSVISASSTSLHVPGKDGSYTYTVTLNALSNVDQSINVYDETGSLITDTPVVVPAGQWSASFNVTALYPSDDTLTASNGFSGASLDVTIN